MERDISVNVLQRRIDSLNKSIVFLESKVEVLKDLNLKLNIEKKQWTEQKIKQEMIIQQQLGNSDGVVKQLQNEIISLKKIMRKNGIKID